MFFSKFIFIKILIRSTWNSLIICKYLVFIWYCFKDFNVSKMGLCLKSFEGSLISSTLIHKFLIPIDLFVHQIRRMGDFWSKFNRLQNILRKRLFQSTKIEIQSFDLIFSFPQRVNERIKFLNLVFLHLLSQSFEFGQTHQTRGFLSLCTIRHVFHRPVRTQTNNIPFFNWSWYLEIWGFITSCLSLGKGSWGIF